MISTQSCQLPRRTALALYSAADINILPFARAVQIGSAPPATFQSVRIPAAIDEGKQKAMSDFIS